MSAAQMFVVTLPDGRIVHAVAGRDSVGVTWPDGHIAIHAVPNYGTAFGELVNRPTCRALELALLDFVVVQFYDLADDCFGYAVNADDASLSEWGYAAVECPGPPS